MIKDYAQRPTTTGKPKRKRLLITIVIVILAIAIPALMYYIRYEKASHSKRQTQIRHLNIPITKAPAPTKITPKNKHKKSTPQFDFYTLLPQTDTSTQQST